MHLTIFSAFTKRSRASDDGQPFLEQEKKTRSLNLFILTIYKTTTYNSHN